MTPNSDMPTRKVTATLIAGAIVTILVWALKQYTGTTLTSEVAAALTMLIGFGVGYMTPPSPTTSLAGVQFSEANARRLQTMLDDADRTERVQASAGAMDFMQTGRG